MDGGLNWQRPAPRSANRSRKLAICFECAAAVTMASLIALSWPAGALACPFCTALRPSLSQRRESADVALLGEMLESAPKERRFRLHRVLKGAERLANREVLTVPKERVADDDASADAAAGSLILLLGRNEVRTGGESMRWSCVPLTEVSYAYFARAPSARLPPDKRLPYFIPFLEHREPLLAEDAYLEFGHAPFDQVARVADRLPMQSLREWLADPAVPADRKGFYGLALGLARKPEEQKLNAEFLQKQILQPSIDFRAGFDGVLGGYLLAAGEPGLELLERRYLTNSAAEGDVRHMLTALRFYHEYGKGIDGKRLSAAMRHLLDRPEFAAAVIVDLARWQDWGALKRIAELFDRPGYADPATDRAIIGYLRAAPETDAAESLERLRRLAPDRVARAEKQLSLELGVER